MNALVRIAATGLVLCASASVAQVDPAFAPVKDDPKLPRVLLIGDSISIGYTSSVRRRLAGKANVHRAPENCQYSAYGLEHLNSWLGDGKWDVIHFNWGIWDTHHFKDGKVRTTPKQYGENLAKLVAVLKTTHAKLIWATTTPLVTYQHGDLLVRSEDIPVYNAAAESVMRENKVAVDDLNSFMLPHERRYHTSDGCHFTPAGNEYLAVHVVNSVEDALRAECVLH